MRLLIVSSVIHKANNNSYAGYTPYIREMNIWLKHTEEVVVMAPVVEEQPDPLEAFYSHPKLKFVRLPEVDTTSFKKTIKSFFAVPVIVFQLFRGMIISDHIHLRCPSNMGLIGVFVQMFFPFKPKTVKYANNWDWNSYQPITYRIQQHILRNQFLTRNAKVLVYGDWGEKSKNIVPFFTASYSKDMIKPVDIRVLDRSKLIKLLFVGTLTPNKRPYTAIQVLKLLRKNGINAELTLLGDGFQRGPLEAYIEKESLKSVIHVKGKVAPEVLVDFFKESHFLIFLSRSEGWPKVVAESMWWGCLPVTTDVSCVRQMVGDGRRGVLVPPDSKLVVDEIENLIDDPARYEAMCIEAMKWSRQYHLEKFEEEIVGFLKGVS